METRDRLVEAGLRVLEQHGLEAVNARRLAAEIGTSTTAVYTNFGGMAGFYTAIVLEAYARLGRRLSEPPATDDPVADLLGQLIAYHRFALADPHRYRLMFGISAPGAGPLIGQKPAGDGGLITLAEVNVAFDAVVRVVRRCMHAGRIRDDDAVTVTGQMWSVLHGYVLLDLAGVFGGGDQARTRVLAPLAINLLVGLGDDREVAQRSVLLAVAQAG